MSTATPSLSYTPTTCSHERGPGTAVCLRCRAELHAQSAARLKRTLVRVGVVAVVVAIGLGIGGGAITANRGTSTPVQEVPTAPAVVAPRPAVTASISATVPTSVPAATAPLTPVASAAALPVSAPVVVGPAPYPIIPRGRTDFEDDIYAERTVGSVAVHFDTDQLRTRRADKFETVVRETLPAMYGSRGDSLLAAVPIGQLTREGELLTALPTRGIHLPAHKGWVMTVWPVTRVGRDGPIVVGYRTSVAKAQ